MKPQTQELERDVEERLIKRFKEHGWKQYKFTCPGRRAVPDRIAILPGGRVFFIELKRPGELPRKDQLAEHAELQAAGANVVVLDSRAAVDAWCVAQAGAQHA